MLVTRCEIKKMVQIKKLVTFTETTFETDHYFSGEAHDFWEIVFVISGKVGVTADKDVYLAQGGDVVIHKPMEFHSIWSEGGTAPEIVILSFDAKSMPSLDSRIFTMTESIVNSIRKISAEAEQIFTYEKDTIEPVSVIKGKEMEASYLVCRLECLIHEILSNSNDGDIRHHSISAKNYSTILSVLENNLYRHMELPELAKLCKMSESNVKKVFSKYAGCGVMYYFSSMKMKKAMELLGNGMSVKETADSLGYSDQNYFSTVFKRVVGISPSKYKAK